MGSPAPPNRKYQTNPFLPPKHFPFNKVPSGRRTHSAPLASGPQPPAPVRMGMPPQKTKSMRFGVIVFPGSNCDHDAFHAASRILGQPAEFIWHDSSTLGNVDAVIL